jgi:hypothetical protein
MLDPYSPLATAAIFLSQASARFSRSDFVGGFNVLKGHGLSRAF